MVKVAEGKIMKNAEKVINGVEYNRTAGILMPVFSLPSKYGIGDLGPEAYRFVDILVESGQTLWVILPHGHTGYCNSPYRPISAFAGNPYFISPQILCQKKLLSTKEVAQYCPKSMSDEINYGDLFANRYKILRLAFQSWLKQNGQNSKLFERFKKIAKFWLKDYSLYMSLKKHFNYRPWNEWPKDVCSRNPQTLKKCMIKFRQEILFWQFVQYEYYEEWQNLKDYANKKGIRIVGDMPFYLEYDSVDVWSRRELFAVKKNNEISWYGGVPGDVFSKYSRNWGVPCYTWSKIAKTNYEWPLKRFEHYALIYDVIRVDHAIGYIRFYGLNDKSEQWFRGPDYDKDNLIPRITSLMKKHAVEIIAEDLGSVPERAYTLFNKYGWEATRVLQFGFTSEYGTQTIHLPLYYPHKSVAYSGTHDNPTLYEYIKNMDEKYISYMCYYLHAGRMNNIHKLQQRMIETLYASSAEKVIIPIADILELDNKARIAHGAEYEKSWCWKLKSFSCISHSKRQWLKKLAFAYARMPFSKEKGLQYGWIWE